MVAQSSWRPILALVLVSTAVQTVIVSRAAVPALDSLRSVAAAEALLQSPSWTTLAEEPEAPLFPVCLAAIHQVRGTIAAQFGWPTPNWAISLQFMSSWPLVAWVIPLYLLARRYFGRRAAWYAGLLACVLPAAARLGGAGLPDSLYLLLFTSSLAVLAAGFKPREDLARPTAIGNWLGSGVLLGLAMLVRVEAVLLLAPVAIGYAVAVGHERLRDHVFRLALMCAGICFVLGPWLLASDVRTPSAVMTRVCSRGPARDGWVFNQAMSGIESEASGYVDVAALNFDSKEPGISARRRGLVSALINTCDELLVATGYLVLPLALLGVRGRIFSPRRRSWNLCAATGVLLWFALGFVNASATGYLSSRHLLPAAVFLLPAAGRGLARLPLQIARYTSPTRKRGGVGVESSTSRLLSSTSFTPRLRVGLVWRRRLAELSIVLVWAACCWLPLHGDRAGHRLAGDWLANRSAPRGRILDSWGWTALYSRGATYRYDAAREAFQDPRLQYVVVEGRDLESGSRRAETLRGLLDAKADCVARFDPPGGQSPVLIFHWRPVLAHNGAQGAVRK
jgi:4-amino-4-deoxy-L-arabinose transferase-like glycosyltransferase